MTLRVTSASDLSAIDLSAIDLSAIDHRGLVCFCPGTRTGYRAGRSEPAAEGPLRSRRPRSRSSPGG